MKPTCHMKIHRKIEMPLPCWMGAGFSFFREGGTKGQPSQAAQKKRMQLKPVQVQVHACLSPKNALWPLHMLFSWPLLERPTGNKAQVNECTKFSCKFHTPLCSARSNTTIPNPPSKQLRIRGCLYRFIHWRGEKVVNSCIVWNCFYFWNNLGLGERSHIGLRRSNWNELTLTM